MPKTTKYLTLLLTTVPLCGALLTASCSPDTENVFGESPALRQQQAAGDYYNILEGNEQGWAVDFYPSELELGGIAYTARFNDGTVTLACEQAIDNRSVSGRYAVGQEVTSDYRIVNGRGVMLTFDTYNPLLHYWSQPSGTDFDGYASDYEFTFVSACADSVVLRGVKHGNLLRMYPLKESAGDYLDHVVAMRNTLSESTRMRLVVNGTTYPVTAMENHIEYTTDGKSLNTPYVYTATGLRFYQPVTIDGVSALELQFDEATSSLKSTDGRMELPAPTTLERFCGANAQWHFVFGRTDAAYDMCDELRTITKEVINALSRQKYETMKDIYLGLNKLPRGEDAQRIVMGWSTAYYSIAYEVCHGIEMTMLSEQASTIDIKATNYGNLFYNYALFQPMLDFVVANSPYVLTFDSQDHPASVRLTSKADATRWFTLKL